MALCSAQDLANLKQANLIAWYHQHQRQFRDIGRREFQLLFFMAGRTVIPTAQEVAKAVETRLMLEDIFYAAFSSTWFHVQSNSGFFAGPLSRYMLDIDAPYIIY